MKRSKKLSLERKYELEKAIMFGNISINELNSSELEYVKNSIKLPYSVIKKFVYLYDKLSPKTNEELFIRYLSGLYGVTSEEVIKRIKEVRGISSIELSSELNKFKTELKVEERKTNIDNRNSEKV